MPTTYGSFDIHDNTTGLITLQRLHDELVALNDPLATEAAKVVGLGFTLEYATGGLCILGALYFALSLSLHGSHGALGNGIGEFLSLSGTALSALSRRASEKKFMERQFKEVDPQRDEMFEKIYKILTPRIAEFYVEVSSIERKCRVVKTFEEELR